MHIARSGQSWQSLLFCVSGQQGMSADIVDMSLIFDAGISFAAAGVASGETTSPMIAKTASNRLMNRQKSIA